MPKRKFDRVLLREQKELLRDVLLILTEKAVLIVGFESILGLEFGTVKGWSANLELGKYLKPEEVALLKVIRSFPWVINAAIENFVPEKTRGLMIHAVADLIMEGKLK